MSTYPIRAHVEGCRYGLSVPVDICACGGRDFLPEQLTLEDTTRTLRALVEHVGCGDVDNMGYCDKCQQIRAILATEPSAPGAQLCGAVHTETRATCEKPPEHTENHIGSYLHGVVQWPIEGIYRGGVMSLDEARLNSLTVDDRRADLIRSAARGQGPTFIAAKLDMLIEAVQAEATAAERARMERMRRVLTTLHTRYSAEVGELEATLRDTPIAKAMHKAMLEESRRLRDYVAEAIASAPEEGEP